MDMHDSTDQRAPGHCLPAAGNLTSPHETCQEAAGKQWHTGAGFSLAAILLLTLVAAIFLAAARTVIVGHPMMNEEMVGLRGSAGAMVGLFVGLGIGLGQPRPLVAACLGAVVGSIVGAAGGALLAEPANLPLAGIGSALLVAFGVVVRVFSDRPRDG